MATAVSLSVVGCGSAEDEVSYTRPTLLQVLDKAAEVAADHASPDHAYVLDSAAEVVASRQALDEESSPFEIAPTLSGSLQGSNLASAPGGTSLSASPGLSENFSAPIGGNSLSGSPGDPDSRTAGNWGSAVPILCTESGSVTAFSTEDFARVIANGRFSFSCIGSNSAPLISWPRLSGSSFLLWTIFVDISILAGSDSSEWDIDADAYSWQTEVYGKQVRYDGPVLNPQGLGILVGIVTPLGSAGQSPDSTGVFIAIIQ